MAFTKITAAGIDTSGTITTQSISVVGISTVGSLSIGATSIISSARQLQNIASLDATTTATIESAVANAPNTFTDLSVTGISTLGVTSATNLTAQSLNVSGISTFTAGPVFIGSDTSTGTASQRLQVTGGAYVSGSVGIGTTNPTSKLQVVGDTRVSGVVTAFDFYNDAEYPNIRPTLDLAFAQTKILDSRITFTRASTATYVNASGLIASAAVNEARFDHDPVTGESLGLLIEESRTNIVSYSQEFNNGYWSKTGGGNPGTTVTANQAVAPDGTTTADYIDYTTAITNSKLIERVFDNTPAGKTYTGSVWIKGTAGQTINLLLDGSGVDVTGEQYTLDGTWQRLSITRTYGPTFSATAVFRFGVRPLALPSGTANQVYAWGAQVELGSFPTSYIPTVASTVTRAADVASITGSAFTNLFYNQQGTLYFQYSLQPADQVVPNLMLVAFSNGLGDYNNVIGIWGSGGC